MQEMCVQSLGQEDPLEKEMATHSRILTWEIAWTEGLGELQSMGSQRVRHYLANNNKNKDALQCCNSLCCRATWISYTYIHIYIYPLFWISFPFRSPEGHWVEFPRPYSRFSLVTYFIHSINGLVVKNLPPNAGDNGSIPLLGISPEEGDGNPLQYSCLGNPMDREAWWATIHRVAKSRTRLSAHTHQWCMCVNSNLPIHPLLLPLLGVHTFILYVCVLQKPVLEKPRTTLRELENSAFLHWWAQRS